MMKQSTSALIGLTLAAALGNWACAGRDAATDAKATALGPTGVGSARTTVTGPTNPVAVPSPSPSPSLLPGVPPSGGASGVCPAGNGVVDASCSAVAIRFYPQVNAVVEQMIAQRPDLFDLTRYVGEAGYLVRNTDAFYAEAVLRLQAAGLCAYYDFTRGILQVKDSNSSSEDYDLVYPNGHLRRGEGSYASTCFPASFPLSPHDVIHHVRVAFYAIECPDGAPPRNGEGVLRMECLGIVTATPKKADGTDVDSRIHGPEVQWALHQVDDYVEMRDFPGQGFNKYLKGLDPGVFSLCATVQGVEGCLNGEVLKE